MVRWYDGRLIINKADIERVARRTFSTAAAAEEWAIFHKDEIIEYYSDTIQPSGGSVSGPSEPAPATPSMGTVTSAPETPATPEEQKERIELIHEAAGEIKGEVGKAFIPLEQEIAELREKYPGSKRIRVWYEDPITGRRYSERKTIDEYARELKAAKFQAFSEGLSGIVLTQVTTDPGAPPTAKHEIPRETVFVSPETGFTFKEEPSGTAFSPLYYKPSPTQRAYTAGEATVLSPEVWLKSAAAGGTLGLTYQFSTAMLASGILPLQAVGAVGIVGAGIYAVSGLGKLAEIVIEWPELTPERKGEIGGSLLVGAAAGSFAFRTVSDIFPASQRVALSKELRKAGYPAEIKALTGEVKFSFTPGTTITYGGEEFVITPEFSLAPAPLRLEGQPDYLVSIESLKPTAATFTMPSGKVVMKPLSSEQTMMPPLPGSAWRISTREALRLPTEEVSVAFTKYYGTDAPAAMETFMEWGEPLMYKIKSLELSKSMEAIGFGQRVEVPTFIMSPVAAGGAPVPLDFASAGPTLGARPMQVQLQLQAMPELVMSVAATRLLSAELAGFGVAGMQIQTQAQAQKQLQMQSQIQKQLQIKLQVQPEIQTQLQIQTQFQKQLQTQFQTQLQTQVQLQTQLQLQVEVPIIAVPGLEVPHAPPIFRFKTPDMGFGKPAKHKAKKDELDFTMPRYKPSLVGLFQKPRKKPAKLLTGLEIRPRIKVMKL